MKNIKPSQLIELALTDLELVEKDNRYNINMASWHTPRTQLDTPKKRQYCDVCLAGAVMSMTLKASPKFQKSPDSFPEVQKELYALDRFRQGDIDGGLSELGFSLSQRKELPRDMIINPYSYSSALFKADMRSMVLLLQQHGL